MLKSATWIFTLAVLSVNDVSAKGTAGSSTHVSPVGKAYNSPSKSGRKALAYAAGGVLVGGLAGYYVAGKFHQFRSNYQNRPYSDYHRQNSNLPPRAENCDLPDKVESWVESQVALPMRNVSNVTDPTEFEVELYREMTWRSCYVSEISLISQCRKQGVNGQPPLLTEADYSNPRICKTLGSLSSSLYTDRDDLAINRIPGRSLLQTTGTYEIFQVFVGVSDDDEAENVKLHLEDAVKSSNSQFRQTYSTSLAQEPVVNYGEPATEASTAAAAVVLVWLCLCCCSCGIFIYILLVINKRKSLSPIKSNEPGANPEPTPYYPPQSYPPPPSAPAGYPGQPPAAQYYPQNPPPAGYPSPPDSGYPQKY